MDPLTGALVMGGVSAVGSYLTNQSNQKFAGDQANQQMNFQQRMSDTSYQRAVADMKAAGLNPALAYQQGGASTPGGAMGSSQAENPLEKLGASAVEVAMMKKELEKKQGEINLSGEMAKTQKTQQSANEASARAQNASAAKALTESQIMNDRRSAIKAEADFSEKENRLREKTLYIDYGAEKLNQIMGVANSAKTLKNRGTKIKEIFVDPKTGEILK